MTRCATCGVDVTEWTDQDIARTLVHAERFIELWTEASAEEVADEVASIAADGRDRIASAGDDGDRIHAMWHALALISIRRRSAGDAPASASGSVAQLNRSGGGVPKLPVDAVDVGFGGLVGDVQATRVHHGRPWQALCLWSAEVIDEIASEGHPIRRGAAGENVTIAGIDWSTMRAGLVLDIGSVRCQLSAPAEPCTKNAQWFVDGRIGRMDHELHPGSSRWYAAVTRPGSIAVGDAVIVEPRTA